MICRNQWRRIRPAGGEPSEHVGSRFFSTQVALRHGGSTAAVIVLLNLAGRGCVLYYGEGARVRFEAMHEVGEGGIGCAADAKSAGLGSGRSLVSRARGSCRRAKYRSWGRILIKRKAFQRVEDLLADRGEGTISVPSLVRSGGRSTTAVRCRRVEKGKRA